jgi:hypothetical protein
VKFDVRWIDVAPYLASGQQPVCMLARPPLHGDRPKSSVFNAAEVARIGKYWVPNGSVFDETTRIKGWHFVTDGEYVHVPVVAYDVVRALSGLFAFGIEVGMAALYYLRELTMERPLEVTLYIGHDCTDLAPQKDVYRCYVGIAIRVQ